jgi:hypothetical protein
MTVLKCFATATLLLSVSACGTTQAYRSDSPYSPAAYDYNQQSTYYRTHYVDGQPTYTSRQPSNYGYGYQAQPTYYGYGYRAQPTYYGYQQQPTYTYYTR